MKVGILPDPPNIMDTNDYRRKVRILDSILCEWVKVPETSLHELFARATKGTDGFLEDIELASNITHATTDITRTNNIRAIVAAERKS